MTPSKKAIELAKKLARSKGRCDKCGSVSGQMQGAHIISVRYSATAALLANIMCLCAHCHRFAPDSWHESPTLNRDWFDKRWPGRWEVLNNMAQKVTKYTDKDWEEIYKNLKDLEAQCRDQQ